MGNLATIVVALTLLMAFGCDKKKDEGTGSKPAAAKGFTLDERSREETRTRTHVSGRAKLATLPLVVRVSDAPEDVAEKVQQGFCAAITKALDIKCTGPQPAKVRLWVSEVDVQLREVAGSIVVDLIGETLLNEGWETADLRLRYGVDGEPPEGKAEAIALGEALGERWAREVRAYLKKMAAERAPSTSVQWVAAPGFMREDTWPLDYGFAEIVADRTWTFQRGKKTGQRVGYLIDQKGTVMRSESFETTEGEGRLAGWGTAADEQRRALLLALPMTAADKEALSDSGDDAVAKKGGDDAMFAVVVLTRGGEPRMVGRDAGRPASAPVILPGGDVVLVTASGTTRALRRLEGMSGTPSEFPLPEDAAASDRFDLLDGGERRLYVVPTAPATKVLATRALPAPADAKAGQTGGMEPIRVLYTLGTPLDGKRVQRHTRLAVVVADGTLSLLDGSDVVAISADGTKRFQSPVGDGVLELNAASDVLAVVFKERTLFLDARSGKPRGEDKRSMSLFAAAGAGKGYLACADPGVVRYDAALKPTHAVTLDDRCEDLTVLPGGDVIVARFLWAARLNAPARWPALP